MKKKYKIILVLIGLEIFFLLFITEMEIHINSWIGNALGTLGLLVPILILFYVLKKDEEISMKYRILAKCLFWFFIVCYIAGGIGKAIALNI